MTSQCPTSKYHPTGGWGFNIRMGVGDSNIQCEAGARKVGPGDGGRGGKRQARPPSFQPEHLGRYLLRDEASGGGKHTQLHSTPAEFKVPPRRREPSGQQNIGRQVRAGVGLEVFCVLRGNLRMCLPKRPRGGAGVVGRLCWWGREEAGAPWGTAGLQAPGEPSTTERKYCCRCRI